MPIVVRNPPRTDPEIRDALGHYGVATIHEAQGRTGLVAPYMTPIYTGCPGLRDGGHGQPAARRQLDDPCRRRTVRAG